MRRRWWLAAAVVLAASVALYQWADGDGTPAIHEPKTEFPDHLRPPEVERAERRRLLVALLTRDAGFAPIAPRPARDPLAAALAPPGKGPGVVIELNALRNSRLGEMLLRCLSPGDRTELDHFRQESGIDPLRDVDRVAFSGDQVIASGSFAGLKLPELAAGPSTPLGEQGKLFGGNESRAVALWGNDLAMLGSPGSLGHSVDRIEGRAPAGGDWLPESATYGDIYGVLPPELLARLLPADQQPFAERFAQIAQRVQFHVDASNDVAMSFDVGGADRAGLADLSQAVSAALTVARLAVNRDAEPELADLLDQARVTPGGSGGFHVDMVLPLTTIERALGDCARAEHGSPGGATDRGVHRNP